MNTQTKTLFHPRSSTGASTVPPPMLGRSVRLNFMGDWGRANLHRALGWLCYELVKLSGPYTKIGIFNGRAAKDNVDAIGRGEYDLALTTPQTFSRLALEGRGLWAGEPFPHLRALGYVPQDDRLICAVRRDLGIRSFDDIRRKKPKLRIAAGIDDGIGFMGFGAQQMMRASGIPRDVFEGWGGTYIENEEPRECIRQMMLGNADAIIQEAVMTQWWVDMTEKLDLTFLSLEPEAGRALDKELSWTPMTLPKNYLRGIDQELRCMDFSHFMLLATTDMPDDIAYALAWALVETFDVLEMQYRHIPPERSPVTYPLNPKEVWKTAIPLHPGAERYYRDAGHMS
jgi:TRAP-type uncharacterized transport system substrate-binding protein